MRWNGQVKIGQKTRDKITRNNIIFQNTIKSQFLDILHGRTRINLKNKKYCDILFTIVFSGNTETSKTILETGRTRTKTETLDGR